MKARPILASAAMTFSACCPGTAFLFHTSSPAPDVYRIDVRPAVPSSTTSEVESIRGDTTALRVDGSAGRIEIVRFDTKGDPIAWAGTVAPLSSFGRAAVPGIELSWTAKPGESIYGTGERFDALNQYGRKIEFWNSDTPAQGGGATYYCAPVFYSSSGYGIFFTNNPEALADFNSDGSGQHRYQRAGTSATFYVAIRPAIKEQIKTRASIQGPYRGLPDWAWGPWISRNSFENQAEAEEAIHGMLDRNMPVAAIVQEAWKGPSETGEFNSFSKTRWPDLPRFLALCGEHGIKNILWQVPIVHPSYPGFAEAAKKGYFVRKPDGSVSFRKAWLADSANIDFTNPDAREYWKDQMRKTVRLGIGGFKADDGEDIKPDDVFSDGRRGWELHNEYSTLYNRTLTELLDEERMDGMLWARSGSLGNETCPALWAGDQGARWDQLKSLLPAGLSASISGMPFWGHDIGGYLGQPSPELYIRWLQFGAFSPLMQYHGAHRREPWEFGPDAEAAYKLLSHLRMNLKPTLIALGREAAETGMPIMRPMALEFPDDPRFASEDSQYMLGPDLLVAPVLEPGVPGRRVKFPAGRWQSLLSPVVYEGPSERGVACPLIGAPVFVREGAALKVQLAEDAALGTWNSNAPIRELLFGPERVAVTNPPIASFFRSPRWVVVGPFPAGTKQAYGIHFPPEKEQGADVAFEAGNRLVQWQAIPEQHVIEQDGVDFNAIFGNRDNAAAYAMTYLHSDKDQDAELRFGSDDTLTVWFNDKQIYSVETYRSAYYDQDVVPVHLVAGENKLLVKVAQDVGAWKLMFRLTGPGSSTIAGMRDGFSNIENYKPDRPFASRVAQQSSSVP